VKENKHTNDDKVGSILLLSLCMFCCDIKVLALDPRCISDGYFAYAIGKIGATVFLRLCF